MEMETFDKVYYSSILIAVAIILFIVVINIIAYKIRKLRTDILQKNNKINVWYNNNLIEELYKKSQSLGKKKYDYLCLRESIKQRTKFRASGHSHKNVQT